MMLSLGAEATATFAEVVPEALLEVEGLGVAAFAASCSSFSFLSFQHLDFLCPFLLQCEHFLELLSLSGFPPLAFV
jgi:hypothetical protein